MQDLELAQKIADGDHAAARTFLEKVGPEMVGYAAKMLRDRSSADDVVQEAMIGVLKSIEKFDGRVSLRSWAFGILRYKIIDAQRKQGRQRVETDADPEAAQFDSSGSWKKDVTFTPWDANKELEEVIELCMKKLPDNQLEALTLKGVLEMPSKEAAAAIGISYNNFRQVLHRARQSVRLCVDGKLGASE